MSPHTIARSPTTPFIIGNIFHSVPFTLTILGSIKPSEGSPFDQSNSAWFNLSDADDFPRIITPFHLAIHPQRKLFIRNAYLYTKGYLDEERASLPGFKWSFKGDMNLVIHVKKANISVSINGIHAFDYQHRYRPERINVLQINGNIELKKIRLVYH